MTREELVHDAARAYRDDPYPGTNLSFGGFLAGVLWADNNRWLKVGDGLPEEGGRYLVWVEQVNDLGIECFFFNCAYHPGQGFTDNGITYRVTHYQIVEPPK